MKDLARTEPNPFDLQGSVGKEVGLDEVLQWVCFRRRDCKISRSFSLSSYILKEDKDRSLSMDLEAHECKLHGNEMSLVRLRGNHLGEPGDQRQDLLTDFQKSRVVFTTSLECYFTTSWLFSLYY